MLRLLLLLGFPLSLSFYLSHTEKNPGKKIRSFLSFSLLHSYQPHDDFFSDEFNVLEEVNRKRERERERNGERMTEKGRNERTESENSKKI